MYLRLRGIGHMGEGSMDDMEGTRVTLIESLSSSSRLTKRSRTPYNGPQVPSCMVDGCSSDLSKCRDYHRRHKVCDFHSKTPKVTICGREQRFCQQCSRFHSLVEFDDRKRSCRKRLDGHNRRRRKPQPATITLNAGRFLYSNQGPRFLPFGNQLLSTSNDLSSSWIGMIKPEHNDALCSSNSQLDVADRRKSMFPGLSGCDYKEKQPPFLNVGSNNVGNVQKVVGNGCALSLLSTPVEAGEINNLITSMVQSNLIPSSHFVHSDGLGFESDLVSPRLVSDGSSDANIRCYSMFEDGPDGSSIDLFRF